MIRTIDVYCDESAHLPNNNQEVMVLGAIWCDHAHTREIAKRIREIKANHTIPSDQEIKWNKVAPCNQDLYLELIDYFFGENKLRFRALLILNKDKLEHEEFKQNHDTWYYKMYYSMLKTIITPTDRFRIYLDIKDTRGAEKVRKLHEILCNSVYDFDQQIIEKIQTVRSHEVEQVQLVDLLIGSVRYANLRGGTSEAKKHIVASIQKFSGYSLKKSTLLREEKINLFFWHPKKVINENE